MTSHPIVTKKKLDKYVKREYENKSDNKATVLLDENTGKVGIRRKEIIDALRGLEGVKRRLKKALDSV